jgi:hypothetical protein
MSAPYISPTRVDSPVVGSLLAAREGKKKAHQQLAALRRQLREAPIGSKSALRLQVLKAQDSHVAWKAMERSALEAIELRAQELGRTTVRVKGGAA